MFRRLFDVFERSYRRVYDLSVKVERYELMEMITEVKRMSYFISDVGRLIVTYKACQ
jgi:hypothetical protein